MSTKMHRPPLTSEMITKMIGLRNLPVKIYMDTEFTDLIGIVCDIKLISAGFVAENGDEFYFELTDHYDSGECSSFVHEAVLPHLNNKKYGMTASEAITRLNTWLDAFNVPVELCSDAVGYDYTLLCDLFNQYGWANNLMKKPINVNSDSVQQNIGAYFECQPMAIRHHALWDARALAYANEVRVL